MSRDKQTRRSILKTSGAALAGLTGTAMVGSASEPVAPCDPNSLSCGDNGGGGTANDPPSVERLTVQHDRPDITVWGNLTSLGDDTSASCWVEWGENLEHTSPATTMSSTGTFCAGHVDGCLDAEITSDVNNVWRAVAENQHGTTYSDAQWLPYIG